MVWGITCVSTKTMVQYTVSTAMGPSGMVGQVGGIIEPRDPPPTQPGSAIIWHFSTAPRIIRYHLSTAHPHSTAHHNHTVPESVLHSSISTTQAPYRAHRMLRGLVPRLCCAVRRSTVQVRMPGAHERENPADKQCLVPPGPRSLRRRYPRSMHRRYPVCSTTTS
eukprot:1288032-Rhodomonas_salina.5